MRVLRGVIVVMSIVLVSSCRDRAQPVAPLEPDATLQVSDLASRSLVYSNFDGDLGFDLNPFHAWTLNGYFGPTVGRQAIGQQFTPRTNVALRAIKLGISRFSGPDSLLVSVHQDSLGLPGPILESIRVGGPSGTTGIVSALSSRGPVLLAAVPYWVSVVASDTGALSGWSWNSIGDTSTANFVVTQGGVPWGPWGVQPGTVRSAFAVTGTPPALGRGPLTLDDVTLLLPPVLAIGGAPLPYDAMVSNRTLTARSNLALQVMIDQGGARAAGGTEAIACGAAIGTLPPGTCRMRGHTLVADTTSEVRGVLTPGAATATVALVEFTAAGRKVLDTRMVPITLIAPKAVIRVDVVPSHVEFASIGAQVQLTAQVQTVGGAPTQVVWLSSNAAVAPVSSQGLVTAVSGGAARITAISVFDGSKLGTSLVSVLTQPSFGTGVNISPGTWYALPGRTLPFAAQVVGGPQSVSWLSTSSWIAAVGTFGQVTAIAPGSAQIRATSTADPTAFATADIEVFDPAIASPFTPTNVSSGVTSPPANPTSVPIVAQVCGPSNFPNTPFNGAAIEVWLGGNWVVIGSSGVPIIRDNGARRCWLWSVNWTPGTSVGIGTQVVRARFHDALGIAGFTPTNALITITDP